MKNKKGDISAEQLVGIIVVVAGGIIALWIVFAIFAFATPMIGGFGCGLNVAIKGAMASNLGGVQSNLIMCNQYREPVEIDATKFSACSGISDFCKNDAKGKDLDECRKQCARIQIDKLADSCWAMGGKGRYEFIGLIQDISETTSSFGKIFLLPFVTAIKGVDDAQKFMNENIPSRAEIIRCYRFQVIQPGITSEKQPFVFSDYTEGRTWLNKVSGKDMGGRGVAAVNPEEGRLPELDINKAGFMLNYNVTQPRQICYIAYYQYETLFHKGTERASVVRTCDYWGFWAAAGTFEFMN